MILASFVAGSAALRAQEPVKLALAASTVLSSRSNQVIKIEAKALVATNAAVSLRVNKARVPVKTTLAPADRVEPQPHMVFALTKKPESSGLFSGQAGNGSFGFANIQAGYGQAYDADSIVMRGRNGTAWEENRYVFIKKIVRF